MINTNYILLLHKQSVFSKTLFLSYFLNFSFTKKKYLIQFELICQNYNFVLTLTAQILIDMLLFANAKINIGLHVVSKRDDGYHQIESILYPVGLSDAVEAMPAKDDKFEFSTFGNTIPGCLKDNLCVKAWELLHKNHHIVPVKMSLMKI